jgi:arylformamidase
MTLYDISRPINAQTAAYPGDAPFDLRWTERLADGGIANVSTLTLSAHLGTHVDSPYHFVEDGERIGAIPLDQFIGPARVVTIPHVGPITPEAVGDLTGVTRLLVRTPASDLSVSAWPETIAYLSTALARHLVNEGIVLFGTDAPSADELDTDTFAIHKMLLGAGILILERLWLREVPDGDYELTALPLKLTEGEASPVRAVLRSLSR